MAINPTGSGGESHELTTRPDLNLAVPNQTDGRQRSGSASGLASPSTPSSQHLGVFQGLSVRRPRSDSGASMTSESGIAALVMSGMNLASMGVPQTAKIETLEEWFHPVRLAKIRLSGPVRAGSVDYYTGVLKKDDHGRLTADDFFVNEVINLARATNPDIDNITLEEGDQMTVSMNPKMIQCLDDMRNLCQVGNVAVKKKRGSDDMVELKGEVSILLSTMVKVMMEGRDAFKDHIKMGIRGHENQHPYDYLSSMTPTITSNNPALRTAVEDAIESRADYCAKLAAGHIKNMAARKRTEPGGWALSTSLAVATSLPWVKAVIPAVMTYLRHQGYSPTREALALAGIDTAPNPLIEFMDTLIGMFIMASLKNEEVNKKRAVGMGTLAAGLTAVTTFANKVMQETGGIPIPGGSAAGAYFVKFANVFISGITTTTQAIGAGISVPGEAQDALLKTTSAVTKSIDDPEGILRMPASIQTEQEAKGYVDFLSARGTFDDPGDGAFAESTFWMMATSMLSVGLHGEETWTAGEKALIPFETMQVFDTVAFQPIEAHTLHAVWLRAKLNLPPILPGEAMKEKMLLAAITRCEVEGRKFTRKDLNDIDSQILPHWGSAISDMVMTSIDFVPNMLGFPMTLKERVPYPTPAAPDEERAPRIVINDVEGAV